jgi:hypothetical protein
MSDENKSGSNKKAYEFAFKLSVQLSIVSSQMAHIQFLLDNKKILDTELPGAVKVLNHAVESIRDLAQIAFDKTKESEFKNVIGKLNDVTNSLNKNDFTTAFAVFQVNTSPIQILLGMKEKFRQ